MSPLVDSYYQFVPAFPAQMSCLFNVKGFRDKGNSKTAYFCGITSKIFVQISYHLFLNKTTYSSVAAVKYAIELKRLKLWRIPVSVD